MLLWQLIVTGVIVHVILFYSIFDIYFTSPLVHGMVPHTSEFSPPAKRLVLFVTDGLRADKLFKLNADGTSIAPFLRNIIETKGSWGVSHTHVPTETRPGHVALIAGFYEDVSAVAKGWKENPVDFDSVFNESRYTWSWGSYDVLPMFSKGASGDHVYTDCYGADLVDFGTSDTDMLKLDTWVLEKVKEFLKRSKTDKVVNEKLSKDKIVFFLHLLGIDTTGHSFKPHSESYMKNVAYADKIIKEVESLIEEYYNHDGQTAYIVTSDHGMTDWGSHGAGHPSETLTPLVAWGAGIQPPQHQANCGDFPDSFCQDWKLNDLKRKDVEQADISPLMTYLIGAPFPVNSVGVLPLDYLNISTWYKAEALYTNVLQMMEQLDVKMEQVKHSSFSKTFKYFPPLSPAKKVDTVRQLKQLIRSQKYNEAIIEGQKLMETILLGLNYYQTYNRFFLGTSIVCGFVGWMAFILQLVLHEHTSIGQFIILVPRPVIKKGFIFLAILISICLFSQQSPWTYYCYCLLPVILWYQVFKGQLPSMVVRYIEDMIKEKKVLEICGSILSTLLALQILVLGFFYRELLSVVLVGMAVWPFLTDVKHSKGKVAYWCISCLLVAFFPLLPLVTKNTNYILVTISGCIQLIINITYFYIEYKGKRRKTDFSWLLVVESILIAVSTIIVYITKNSIEEGNKLPIVCQILSWLLLVLCPILPLLSSKRLLYRLNSILLVFTAIYQLMCITYESLFLLFLCLLLYNWLYMEYSTVNIYKSQKSTMSPVLEDISFTKNIQIENRQLELADLRRTFFFIFLTLIGFFGTGNIASINSFDPVSVYCFLTVFKPDVMGILMIIKNLLPLLMVTCIFQGVHVIVQVPIQALFLLVLLMSDFMGLHFFFLVQDTGAWLDIGTSISHYVIVMSMIIFLMLLFGLAHILTNVKIKLFAYHKD